MQKTNKDLLHSIRKGLGCAAACAAMALAASTLPATAWAEDTSGGNTTTTVIGIETLKGKTLSDSQKAAVTAGSYPTDDMSKIFFLYNVKTKKFLNAGGYYGTHVSLKETPLSLWINKYSPTSGSSSNAIDFAQGMTTGQGHLLRYLSRDTESDNGIFIDRLNSDGYGWTLEAVSDGYNTYKLYTYKSSSSRNTKYYLCANGDEADVDKNCEAFTTSDISKNNLSGYDQWRIFSMQQIYDLQDENTEKMTESIGLTFKLKCPGFSRGNNDITNWKTATWGTGTNGGARFGLEKMYNKTPKAASSDGTDTYDVQDISDSNPYTFYNTADDENGTKYTDLATYKCNMAKYFCADAKNVHGIIYQEVTVKHGGTYVIECKGFSTTTEAKLFAVLFRDNTVVDKTLHETVLCQTSYMSSSEQKALHISEQNMDYAGKNFYSSHKYFNSVLVHVPEVTDGGSNYVIRFGIAIGDEGDKDSDVKDGEWTVFDDFRLLYASKTIDEDLILDEDRIDLSYLTDCKNNYRNKVLHLNKTFTRDKWNSFILPVNLTNDQFRMAFGGNARLAKLSKLTSTQVQFTTVNTDEKGSGETVLKAYTPYIIFPTRYIAESPAYKALLTKTGDSGASKTTVIIKKNIIEIPNVSFAMNDKNENDLSNIDTKTWTVKTTDAHTVSGDGSMTAYGTLARTFDKDATQVTDETQENYGEYVFSTDKKKKGTIISGRDDLTKSYFFWNGNFYYSEKRARGLRGFSCWFKPTYSSTAKTTLFIDGVAQDSTTDISDLISNGGEEPRGKAAEGVFSLSGQRISDAKDINSLPAGMYIVNGKKYVVK